MTNVFCTRALQEADHEQALQNGIKLTTKSFIHTVPVLSKKIRDTLLIQLNRPYQTLLFTSKNAVQFTLKNYLHSIPEEATHTWQFYCLSGATRSALLKYFNAGQIVATADNATDLIQKIAAQKHSDPVHFFCGDKRRNTLPDYMQSHHIPYKEWIVYKTNYTPHTVDNSYQAYLFYSPSAVESFFSVNTIDQNKPCFSLGHTTASALKKRVTNPVYTSEKPDTLHLLQLLFNYFKTENGIFTK